MTTVDCIGCGRVYEAPVNCVWPVCCSSCGSDAAPVEWWMDNGTVDDKRALHRHRHGKGMSASATLLNAEAAAVDGGARSLPDRSLLAATALRRDRACTGPARLHRCHELTAAGTKIPVAQWCNYCLMIGLAESATPQNAGATPTGKPVEVGAHNSTSSSLLSPVEGRQPVDDDTKNDHGC